MQNVNEDVRVEVNGGQTTTFFLKTEVSRPRPLGVITSTKGAFVNEGTTTEYTTQIVGTSVDGTYAKIQSTKSRVFSLVPTDLLLDLPVDLLPIGLVSSSLVTRIRGETTTIETTEFVRTFIDQAYVQEILTSSEIFAPLRSVDDQAVDVQPSPVNQIVIPTVIIDSSLADEEEAGKIVFKTSHLTSLVGERVIQSSISGIVPAFDEDKPTDDESKKLITSFEEIPDNNLRGSRARSDLVEPVVQTKPVVALETFVAGQPSRVADPAVAETADELQETTTLTSLADDAPTVELDAIEPVEEDVETPEEPAVPVKIVTPVSDAPKDETPVSEQLAVISAVESDGSLLDEPLLDDVQTDQPESSTDLPESVTELFVEDELTSQDKQREPRVEIRPPVPVAATLQLRPAEPIRPVGLISTFEGSLVNDGITTVYTSLVFGTIIDGEWANVVSTVTKVLTPTVQVLTVEATPPVAVVATALPDSDSVAEPTKPELDGSLSQPIEASAPVTETPQGLLPVTRVTTFTFFTTFTETKGEDVLTSVSTREVVSSEVQFVEETIQTDDIIEMMLGEPGNETNPSLTTIFKTYTYFSTLFDDSTTKMITREEVESTVVTLTDAGHQLATPVVQETTKLAEQLETATTTTKLVDEIQPSVIESSLMDAAAEGGDVTSKRKQLFSSLASGIVKTFFTTFTFFTTALVNGTTVVSSRIVVSTNAVTPTVQLTDIDEELWESLKAQDDSRKVTASETAPVLVAPSIDVVVPVVVISTPVVVESVSQPPDILEPVTVETSEEPVSSTDIIPTPPEVVEAVPVETDPIVSSEAPTVSEEPVVIVSEEPPVEEMPTIEPSTATEPSLPQTFYTTFTYLTTFFTEGTSNIVSREETVTNVLTETDLLVVVEPTVPSVFPITYFTTFTYRTTSFSEGETFVSTREETVTNIVTPTVGAEASDIEPTTTVPIAITPTPAVDPALTTFYTTFTYFETSFEADTAIVTSSLETVTNIVSASETIIPSATLAIQPTTLPADNSARNIGNNGVSQLILDLADDKTNLPSLTGLLSTIRSTRINNGVTTVFSTDVLGTFINGQYARILESSSEVLNPAAKVPATVIVAASGVEGLEATDLFPGVVSPSAELEGSIVQPVSPSISASDAEEQGNEGGSKVDGGRITTRLSAPARNRTFVPTIRPFTQRPRPPLPTRPRRPPFTSASSNDDTSSASTVSLSPASISGSSSSSSSRTAPFSSRFRPSAATSLVVATTTATESSSRSQFFRLRSSASPASSNTINPTPVLASASTGLPPRRFSSNSFSPSIAASRSSLGGLAARRPSVLSSGVRPSSPSTSTAIASSTSTTPRFARPSTAAPIVADDDTTDDNVETVTPAIGRAVSNFRRPAPVRASSPVVEPSSPVVPSRRQFPFSRSTARPAVTESTRAPSESTSSNSASSSEATSRPRFVRPPKLTFTEKPRPAVKLPTRPAFRSEAVAASNIEEVTVEAPLTNERSKRQIDFDYYFYDPLHYRRPSRSKTSRTRGRTTSASRVIESDYDYDVHLAQLNGQDYEIFDYDEPKTTRPRQTSSSSTSASTSALRDRLRANQQSRNQATTPATRSRSRTNSATSSSSGRQSAIGRNRKPAPEEVGGTSSRNRATTGSSASRSRPDTAAAARQRQRTSTTTERTSSSGGRRFGNSRRNQNRNRVTNDFPEDDGFISAEPVLPSSAPPLTLPLTVTHRIPTDTTIPVVNNGKTEFRTVIAAKPSVEILEQYSTLRVGGAWRYIASEVSATPAPGTTLITQFVLKPSETTTVTFTPTTIRGRPTSFSHVVPSTAFEVETVVSTLTDPLASTNSLLQQLLLGGLQQANGVPVTSFNTHTSTFVTTLTELKTTKIPITLRGQEIFTTIIGTSTSVITATEFSTETIVIGPTESPQGNPLASLLPALLGNQLLQAQLLAPQLQPTQVLPILPTLAPQAAIIPEKIAPVVVEEVVASRFDEFEEVQFEPIEEEVQQPEPITPAKPIPLTSVITLFLSGRRPGEFSSILSTITLDGVASDVTVVKRQIDPSEALPMEASQLPLMVGTDKGIYELPEHYSAQDLDYYLMSAINEIDAETIDDAGETSRLASIVRKAKRASGGGRKVRQVASDDLELEEEPLESIESQIDEIKVEPLPGGRGALRRKTVTVTRKVSEPVSERKIGEEFVSNNRGRKVVVVTRRRPVSATATEQKQQEPMARRIDSEQDNDTEAKPFVVVRKRPVNRAETISEAPALSSSLIEPETESPSRGNNLFGDIYAPRTYYTVYSYFYTLLNGPNSGQVSTREVSISEIVRGSDGRIPSGFQRTENGNGLYPLSSGKSVADLSTRVNNGVTTQVNLASMTLVKYGRGAVRASSIGVKPKDETPVRSTTQQPRRINIVPSPRVEPSFDDFISELDEVTVQPTQKLPAVTRTRGRATDQQVRSTATRQPAIVEEAATSRPSGSNRGRGTVRFNPATVLGESLDIPLATISRPRGPAESRVPQRAPSPPSARGPVRGSVRGSVTRDQIVDEPVVRTPVRGRGRPQPVQQEQDLFAEEEPFIEEEEFFDNEFTEDPPLEEDYFYDHHEEDLPLGHEEEYDYFTDVNEPGNQVDVNAVETATPAVKTTPAVATSSSSTVASSTKVMGVTPTRTTISRKLLNPLQSHLSSILANSRSGLRASSSVQRTNEPGSSIPFRSRASKSSVLPTFTTSTVVLKQFQTLSTLAVDGGRSGIPLTLITSSLTTLFDSEISLLTESPDVFKAVVQPTLQPISRPKPLILNPTARLTLPIRASVAIGLLPSTGTVESTIEDTSDTTESGIDTTELPSISELLLLGGNVVTVVETQLKTFTAVVTRKSGTEEEVTTRLEVLPELVTKTIVRIEPTSGNTNTIFFIFLFHFVPLIL